MEDQVKQELKRVLGIEAVAVERTKHGEGNHNFFVTDVNGKRYVFKAFKNGGWPEAYKNRWISSVLLEKGVRSPKVLIEDRNSPVFEHGFLIVEFIEGRLALDALNEGFISVEEYYSKLLKELEKVHQINLPRFGYTNQGEGSKGNYIEFLLDENQEKINELINSNFEFKYGEKLLEEIKNTNIFINDKPSLVHHDIGLDNVVIDANKEIFIIDWDSAMSHPWSLDLAYLTFSARDIHDMNKHKENVARIHELIKQSYKLPVSFEGFLQRERIHHLNYLVGFIHHEYFNMEDLNEAKAYLGYFNKLMGS